jgi:hypothetical protein
LPVTQEFGARELPVLPELGICPTRGKVCRNVG